MRHNKPKGKLAMKKIFCIIILMILCTSCTETTIDTHKPTLQKFSPIPTADCKVTSSKDKQTAQLKPKKNESAYTPINFDEQKAVWISYIDLQPMLKGKSQQQFSENISEAYDNIQKLGCNTVYVHVRSFGDTYYKSEIYPYSKDITGEIGQVPDFDPLEIMIQQAHDKGLSFHAWINPMRCETEENMQKINDSYSIKKWYSDTQKYDEYIVKSESDNHYWLNPAVEDVRKLIAEGAAEIVKNYNVDGVHIDDYFYPTTDVHFDSGIYVETGVTESLSDWRLDNVNKMVKGIYDAIKSVNKSVLFGISPQGNIENNYEYMYADVKKWGSEAGYADYIVPQIYFGLENAEKPFEQTAKDWSDIVTCQDVKLVIGLGMYKIGQDDEFLQTTGIIGEQIDLSKKLDNYNGIALYNYINLFEPKDDLVQRTSAELKCIEKAFDNP